MDAYKLARLALADMKLLAPIEHRSAEQQTELALIRARDAILRARTLLINTARGIAKGFGVRLPKPVANWNRFRCCSAMRRSRLPNGIWAHGKTSFTRRTTGLGFG